VEDEIRKQAPLTEQPNRQRLETPVETPAETHRGTLVRRERFGSLRQRRRRVVLAVSAALLVGAVLVSAMPILGEELGSEFSFLGGRQAEEGSQEGSQEGSRGVLAGDSQGAENEGAAPHKDKPGSQDSSANEGAEEATDVSRPPGQEEVELVEVPDVSNQRVAKAARVLVDVGFTVTAIKTEASPVEAGTATGTEPSAGSAAEPGATVTLIKSGGPNWVPPGTRNRAGGTATAAQYGN
jgi:hypothetical protein